MSIIYRNQIKTAQISQFLLSYRTPKHFNLYYIWEEIFFINQQSHEQAWDTGGILAYYLHLPSLNFVVSTRQFRIVNEKDLNVSTGSEDGLTSELACLLRSKGYSLSGDEATKTRPNSQRTVTILTELPQSTSSHNVAIVALPMDVIL